MPEARAPREKFLEANAAEKLGAMLLPMTAAVRMPLLRPGSGGRLGLSCLAMLSATGHEVGVPTS